MKLPDLNLLPALDALLREGSVTKAAERLSLSTPAMSRTLARLRRVTGDPLLVPAGRGLVPTPAALALRPRVEAALAGALAVLEPVGEVDLATLRRTFSIRANDALVTMLGPALTARLRQEAPGVTLRFLPEGDEEPSALRDTVDLDMGVLRPQPPDVFVEQLVTETLVGVVRADHSLGTTPVDLAAFARTPQVTVSRRGRVLGPVDELLAERGLSRTVTATLPTYAAAAFTALAGEVIALLPRSFARHCSATLGLKVLELPLALPPLPIAQAWHQRVQADVAHRWLRTTTALLVRQQAGDGSP